MSQAFSFDVTQENFVSQVVEASHQHPVLVDFWATWCGPCQSLMPILEQLAQQYQGKFLLAKVEIDSQQALASQFSVRSVPTVKLVKNGQIVDEFTGALPEGQIRAFLDKHIESESDQRMQGALLRYQQGETDTALTEMGQILQDDPQNENNKIIYADVLIRENHLDEAKQWLATLPVETSLKSEVRALQARLEFIEVVQHAPDPATLQNTLNEDPGNSEARYQLSAYAILQGQFELAFEQLLEIVKRDRNYNDDAGRKALLKLFELLGDNHELVNSYRRKLAMALN
ncbi:MAG: thioredoxin [Thiohalomonadales bacterium]|nr:thioredoxin [Thiohalomonadales bacterium]